MNRIERALLLIKEFEGCRLRAYQDSVGVWTIGYGATGGPIKAGLVWTQPQAEEDLRRRVSVLDESLTGLETKDQVILTEMQGAALLSMAYNLGFQAVASSTLWGYMKAHDVVSAALEFPKWARAGKLRLKGLLKRRFLEGYTFLS